MFIKELLVKTEIIPLTKPFKTALRVDEQIENIVVEIVLEDGITGVGAAAPTFVITGDSHESIEAALVGPIRTNLIGKDIIQLNDALKAVQECCVGNTSAKAAADIALHNAYCNHLGISVSSYLGGCKKLSTCMTVRVDTVERMQAEAKKAVEAGYSVLKIKVGDKAELDVKRMAAIMEVVPETVTLRLDANQGWKPKEAVKLILRFEELAYPIEFIE